MAKPKKKSNKSFKGLLIPIAGFVLVAFGLAWFFESQATTTLIFVRHADKAELPADDPALSAAGQRRAVALANALIDVDVVAGIDAIYATQFKRTQETAQPLAGRLQLPVSVEDASDIKGMLERVLSAHKGKIVLIVAHANTIPDLIAELGGSKNVPKIAEDEYDNLYIVSIPWFGKTKTLRLRYGTPQY